jgi:hypothetical protein
MASTCVLCNPALKKLVKLLKGIDQHYPDSVTQQMRREYREAIARYYGDDYMLETLGAAIDSGEAFLKDLEKIGNDVMYTRELRIIRYLNIINEELDRKWREINHMVVGHCGTPCNLGCPECEPGGYDHAGEV